MPDSKRHLGDQRIDTYLAQGRIQLIVCACTDWLVIATFITFVRRLCSFGETKLETVESTNRFAAQFYIQILAT
jgi:hypothetical protein